MDATTKQRLRGSTRAARAALTTEQRQHAAARIVTRLLALPQLRAARTVLLYAAVQDEVELTGLIEPLRRRGTRMLFPRVRGPDLELAAATDPATLEVGYRGVREPTGRHVDPGVVDVALLPGLAFDPRGGRLGSGGGHYDRLLATLPPATIRIGVGFTCQVVPQVPREAHDQPVHLVVTETAVHRAMPGDTFGDTP